MKRFAEAGRWIGWLLIVVLLTACSENTDDLTKYIQSVKARPVDPIEPIPPVKTYMPYSYGGVTERDPFHQSLREGSDNERTPSGAGPHPDWDRPKEYLERFGLDTLTMVGTFSNDASSWALVQDPEAVIHRVPVGKYLGKNHGKIIRISDTQIYLDELIPDDADGWFVRHASIALNAR